MSRNYKFRDQNKLYSVGKQKKVPARSRFGKGRDAMDVSTGR